MKAFNLFDSNFCPSPVFAEIYFNRAEARKFDVELEGRRVFADLDIYKEAGAAYKAVIKTARDVSVTGNALTLRLVKGVQNPKLQGIKIVPSSVGPSSTPSPGGGFRKFINAGGSRYIDPRGNVWEADTGFYNAGSSYSTGAAISDTDLDPMYQVERWGEITYTIPGIPRGTYDVVSRIISFQ